MITLIFRCANMYLQWFKSHSKKANKVRELCESNPHLFTFSSISFLLLQAKFLICWWILSFIFVLTSCYFSYYSNIPPHSFPMIFLPFVLSTPLLSALPPHLLHFKANVPNICKVFAGLISSTDKETHHSPSPFHQCQGFSNLTYTTLSGSFLVLLQHGSETEHLAFVDSIKPHGMFRSTNTVTSPKPIQWDSSAMTHPKSLCKPL